MFRSLERIASHARRLPRIAAAGGIGAALGLTVLLAPSLATPASAQYKCSYFLYCGTHASIYYDYTDQATYRYVNPTTSTYYSRGYLNPTYYSTNGVVSTTPPISAYYPYYGYGYPAFGYTSSSYGSTTYPYGYPSVASYYSPYAYGSGYGGYYPYSYGYGGYSPYSYGSYYPYYGYPGLY